MKAIINIIAGLALCTGLYANEQAKEPAHAVNIVSLEANIVRTPNFEAKGVERKEMEARRWLEIEAEVEVKTSDPSGYIPALQAEWHVVVMQEMPGKKVEVPFKLSGISHYKDVRAKDGKVYLSAYVEPKTLERFFGDDRIRPRSDFKTIALKLSGEGVMTKGRTALSTDEKIGPMLTDWKHDYSDSAIVSKSKTPFALIAIDRYPEEKVD